MKFRQLRVMPANQWVDVLFTVQAKNGAPDVFSVPPESHQRDIAAALGLPVTALEVVDADSDVRVAPLLPIPKPAATPPTERQLLQAQVITDAADNVTAMIDRVFMARSAPLTAAEKQALSDAQKNLIAKAQEAR